MIVIIILLILILAAVLLVTAFDYVPEIVNMFKRRGIGDFDSPEEWLDKAENRAEQWLVNGIPVVPRDAQKRFVIFDIIKGIYKFKSIQHWQEASVLLAMNEISPESASSFIDEKISQSDFFETDRVDIAMLAYAMLENSEADKISIKPQMDTVAQMLLEKFGRLGRIPYSRNEDVCFVDTIGMVCPFLIKYAVVYNNDAALYAAVKIIKDYSEKGVHSELGLPVHCYDIKNSAPLGIYGWGRGSGWWAYGLADSFMQLSRTDGYLEEKAVILKELLRFADTVLEYQLSSGAFDRNLLSPSGEDSSATSMLAYFFAYAGKLTEKKQYTEAASKALEYIYSVTRRDGTVDYSQGDTIGVGFYSTAAIVVPAAQGFALRAYMMLKEGESV